MAGTNAAAPYGSNSYGAAFKSQQEADDYEKRLAERNKNLSEVKTVAETGPVDFSQQGNVTGLGTNRYDTQKFDQVLNWLENGPGGSHERLMFGVTAGSSPALTNYYRSKTGDKNLAEMNSYFAGGGNKYDYNKAADAQNAMNNLNLEETAKPGGGGALNLQWNPMNKGFAANPTGNFGQEKSHFGTAPGWTPQVGLQQLQGTATGQWAPQGGQQGSQTGQAGQGPGQQPGMGGKKGQQPPGMQGGGNLMLGPAGMTTTGGPNQLGIGGGGQTGPGSYWSGRQQGPGSWNWSGRDQQQQTPPGGWNASNGGVMIGQGQVYDPNNPNAGAIYGPPGSGFGGGAQKRWGGGAMGGRMIQDPNQQQQPAAQPSSPWNPDTQTGYQSTEGYQQATGLPAATTNAPGQATSPATPGASPATPGAAPQPGAAQQPWGGQQPGKNQKAQKPPSMQAGGGMGKGRAPQAPQGY